MNNHFMISAAPNACNDVNTNPPTPTLPPDCMISWVGDGYCDDNNNVAGCWYDGGDCCNSTKPNWDYQCDV